MRQPGQIPASADLDNIVGMQRERPTLIHKQEYRLAAIALERDRQGVVRRENVEEKRILWVQMGVRVRIWATGSTTGPPAESE